MGKLTAVAVKAATKPGRYQDGQGLQLFVKESGAQFWVLRIQAGGKRRDVGRGAQPGRPDRVLGQQSRSVATAAYEPACESAGAIGAEWPQ